MIDAATNTVSSFEDGFANYERVEIEGKALWLPPPDPRPRRSRVRRDDLVHKALAAWLDVDGGMPLGFRLYGPSGVGKNCVIEDLAEITKRDLYVIKCHEEIGPEDIVCSPVMTSQQRIEYHASPLVTAILRGKSICLFDEIAKAPVSALAPLASLLDHRRSLTSMVAGLRFHAQLDFVFCATLEESEEEGLGLPEFIDQRTRPAIRVGTPDPDVFDAILRANLPNAADIWYRTLVAEFIDGLSPRAAVTLLTYAHRLFTLAGERRPTAARVRRYLATARAEVAAPNERREIS